MLLPYPKTHPEVYTAFGFFEHQNFESNDSYLKSIDPICQAELSLIDCFVKSLGLQLVYCIMRGNVQ